MLFLQPLPDSCRETFLHVMSVPGLRGGTRESRFSLLWKMLHLEGAETGPKFRMSSKQMQFGGGLGCASVIRGIWLLELIATHALPL